MQFTITLTPQYHMVLLFKAFFKNLYSKFLKKQNMYKPIGLSNLISRRYGWTGTGAEFTIAAAEKWNNLRPQFCGLQSLGDDLTAVGNTLGKTLESDWRPSPILPAVMLMKQFDV